MSTPLNAQEIKERLEDHTNVHSDSIEILDDQVVFRLIDPTVSFPFKWKGHEVMENDCEDYEGEMTVFL